MTAPAQLADSMMWRMASLHPRRLRTDSLLRNSVYMMATTAVNSSCGYLYWTLAARSYAPREVGLAAALVSALMMASTLANAGVGSALVQMLPARPSGRPWSLTLNAGLVAGALAGLAVGVVAVVALPLASSRQLGGALRGSYAGLFVVGVAWWTVATVLDWAFVAERAAGRMLCRNAVSAVAKIVFLIACVRLLRSGAAGIVTSTIAASACGVLAGCALLPGLRRGYGPALRGATREVRAMAPALAGHHAVNLGGVAPMYLLPLLITVRLSATEAAYFYTAWMIGGVLFIVSPAVASSLFAEGVHRADGLRGKARSGTLIIAALLAPAMLALLLGGRLVLAAFGPSYARHGAILLAVLVVAAVPDAITNVYVSVLRVRKQLRLATALNAAMAALTLMLAWALLPALGVVGAGWAWLAAQAAGSVAAGVHLALARRAADGCGDITTPITDGREVYGEERGAGSCAS